MCLISLSHRTKPPLTPANIRLLSSAGKGKIAFISGSNNCSCPRVFIYYDSGSKPLLWEHHHTWLKTLNFGNFLAQCYVTQWQTQDVWGAAAKQKWKGHQIHAGEHQCTESLDIFTEGTSPSEWKGHPRGYFITFCPLEGHPGPFSHFLHWKGTQEGT